MLRKIALGLVVLLALLAIVIALRPSDFRVSRSATMAAPPAAIFAKVNDLREFNTWSPFAKMDPNAKFAYEGPASGVGAKNTWDGNQDLGAGSMTITTSEPARRVGMQLDFIRPFAGTNQVEFTLEPAEQGTKVTWNMEAKNGFMAKAVGLVMDCEKMCGNEFEKGLANLKAAVETPQAKGDLLTMQPQP